MWQARQLQDYCGVEKTSGRLRGTLVRLMIRHAERGTAGGVVGLAGIGAALGGSLYVMTFTGLLMPGGNEAYMWTIPGSTSFVFSFAKKKSPPATAL
jgi:hypothetical protein